MTESSPPAGASAGDPPPLLTLRVNKKSFGPVHVLRGRPRRSPRPGHRPRRRQRRRQSPRSSRASRASYSFDAATTCSRAAGQVHDRRQANALGIEVVYQDLALCDNLDVVHNMFLGREEKKRGTLDEDDMEMRASRRSTACRSAR